MSDKQFSYTFKITSSITKINLPFAIKNVNRLKINFLSYKTASAGNKLMLIKISQFNTNYYYDGLEIIKYSKALAMPPSNSTPLIYENQFNNPDVIIEDVSKQNGLNTLTLEILIDGVYSADISPSNPLYTEITIF